MVRVLFTPTGNCLNEQALSVVYPPLYSQTQLPAVRYVNLQHAGLQPELWSLVSTK